MLWIGIWFGALNTCGVVWSNGVGKNSEANKEHDEDRVDERFHQLASVNFDRADEVGRDAVSMVNFSINI